MSKVINNNERTGVRGRARVMRIFASLLILLVVIAISIGIFIFRDKIVELKGFGYAGAFLVSLVSNATIVLPAPGILIIMALGASLSPVLVGLAAGVGAAIGEMSCYLAGVSGRGLIENSRLYDRLEGWLNKWGFLAVFVFAATPLPFDILGIAAGILRYPLWKFFFACCLGKIVISIVAAYAGFYGWQFVLPYLS